MGLRGHSEGVIGDGCRCFACRGARSRASGARVGSSPGGDNAEHALFAGWALQGIATSQPAKEVMPRFANRLRHGWRGVGQELPRSGDELAASSIGLKAVMSDTDKTARQHVEEESVDELIRLCRRPTP